MNIAPKTGETEVLFYHLEHRSLESVLPGLLERSLQRGWKAVVQTVSQARVEAIDALLWSYTEDSFLPHGRDGDAWAARQPIVLATGETNPNGADVRFVIDGAEIPETSGYRRIVYLFDGRKDEAVTRAREEWKRIKAYAVAPTYWQQNEQGRWEKRA
jgi:DNA polymerase-3 subunit chi